MRLGGPHVRYLGGRSLGDDSSTAGPPSPSVISLRGEFLLTRVLNWNFPRFLLVLSDAPEGPHAPPQVASVITSSR